MKKFLYQKKFRDDIINICFGNNSFLFWLEDLNFSRFLNLDWYSCTLNEKNVYQLLASERDFLNCLNKSDQNEMLKFFCLLNIEYENEKYIMIINAVPEVFSYSFHGSVDDENSETENENRENWQLDSDQEEELSINLRFYGHLFTYNSILFLSETQKNVFKFTLFDEFFNRDLLAGYSDFFVLEEIFELRSQQCLDCFFSNMDFFIKEALSFSGCGSNTEKIHSNLLALFIETEESSQTEITIKLLDLNSPNYQFQQKIQRIIGLVSGVFFFSSSFLSIKIHIIP